MKGCLPANLLACCVLVAAITAGGCCINFGSWNQERYEKTEQASAAMAEAEQISVDTSFGEITITGAETSDCNVTAKITGQAPTDDEARSLAEQTHIKLEMQGQTLVVRAEKPHVRKNRSIVITYNIIVPTKTGIKCKSSYGEIKLTNIKGNVIAKTSFGDIVAENITGRMQLNTSYGKVDCRKITCAGFEANSSFGDIEVGFSNDCPSDLSANVTTSYGGIDADVPTDFAGEVVIETSFGKIKTEVPLMIKGDLGKTHLTGTVGEGNGKLNLKTSFGSVTLR
jgi:DUF4097 and DUF4098 domain-containing protein YvlB